MTNSDYTAIAIVLDRSGSMASIQSDAQGALNSFVEDQKKIPGKATLTLAKFNQGYELVYINKPLEEVPPVVLTPLGSTALLDAIGDTITKLGEDLAAMDESDRPGKVLVVIVTDGYENSSKEWSHQQVFDLITEQREKWNWDFVFLAANQDAVETAARMGISLDSAKTFVPTGAGVRAGTQSVSAYAASYRTTGKGKFDKDDNKSS